MYPAGLYLYHNLPILQIHKILAIRLAVPILIQIFTAGCINLYDIIIVRETDSFLEKLRCYCFLSVLKAWVGLFLVKIDMLNCWLHFSNTQQCVGTTYILCIEVCLVIKKKVATCWKTADVSKRTANVSPTQQSLWPKRRNT